MEKQLESLTELVKELTKVKSNKSLYQQFYELKIKTNTLRNDLLSIRYMQQSLKENFHIELEEANKKIQVNYLFISIIEYINQHSFLSRSMNAKPNRDTVYGFCIQRRR